MGIFVNFLCVCGGGGKGSGEDEAVGGGWNSACLGFPLEYAVPFYFLTLKAHRP